MSIIFSLASLCFSHRERRKMRCDVVDVDGKVTWTDICVFYGAEEQMSGSWFDSTRYGTIFFLRSI